MKRLLLALALVALGGFVAAAPAAAKKPFVPSHSSAHGASILTWQERWSSWALGSDTNPLLSGVCGEQVGKLFFLTQTVDPVAEIDCELPPGTPLLASPAGVAYWASPGETDAEVLAGRDAALATASTPLATIDGRSLDVEDAVRVSDLYTIPLEPGNFIQTVDPTVIGDDVRLASGGWFIRIPPLSPGEHELVLTAIFEGGAFTVEITYNITVGRGG